jgi:hypothetical protein
VATVLTGAGTVPPVSAVQFDEGGQRSGSVGIVSLHVLKQPEITAANCSAARAIRPRWVTERRPASSRKTGEQGVVPVVTGEIKYVRNVMGLDEDRESLRAHGNLPSMGSLRRYSAQYVVVGTLFIAVGILLLITGHREGVGAVVFGLIGCAFAAGYRTIRR